MAKKTTPKRLDPNQEFQVHPPVTRKAIAEAVNEMIENEGWDVPELTPDDERLDDEFCQDWANMTYEAICEVDEIVDREYQHQKAVAAGHFDLEVDDDS
jgi:hypothetical protein